MRDWYGRLFTVRLLWSSSAFGSLRSPYGFQCFPMVDFFQGADAVRSFRIDPRSCEQATPVIDTRCRCVLRAQLCYTFTESSNTHRSVYLHFPAGLPTHLCSWGHAPSSPTCAGFDGPLPFPNWVPCGLGPAGDAERPDTTPRERQSSRGAGSTINLCKKTMLFHWKTVN